jgi:hypothetical protein
VREDYGVGTSSLFQSVSENREAGTGEMAAGKIAIVGSSLGERDSNRCEGNGGTLAKWIAENLA